MSKEQKYVFLSGPIAGVQDYKEKFAEAEEIVRKAFLCQSVWNPAKLPDGWETWQYMAACMDEIAYMKRFCHKDDDLKPIVVTLPDIGPTSGANIEIAYAKYLGIEVVRLEEVYE